jgi:hypothetical protein
MFCFPSLVVQAYMHGAIITLGMAAIFEWGNEAPGMQNLGLWDIGSMANAWVVMVCTVRLCADVSNWNRMFTFFTTVRFTGFDGVGWTVMLFRLPAQGSVAVWFIFFAIFSSMLTIATAVFGSFPIIMGMPAFWLGTLLIVWTCLLPTFASKSYTAMFKVEVRRWRRAYVSVVWS